MKCRIQKMCKKILPISVISLIACSCASIETQDDTAMNFLVPTPKQLQIKNKVTIAQPYSIDDKLFKLSPALISLIDEEFTGRLKWSKTNTKKAKFLITFKREKISDNKEAYKLEISKAGACIAANTQAALFLGVNRLRAILSSPDAMRNADDTLTVNQLSITDYPDFPLRGMHLEMSGSKKYKQRIYKTLDAMAKMGFNLVVLEIGGRYESKLYPGNSWLPCWTQKEIKGFIAYSKGRGLLPVPGLNAIGHLGRAPKIFPLTQKVKGKDKLVAMNLAHPKFYEVYFNTLGEIIDLFEQPPYIHLGTDEFFNQVKMLEKLTGKSGHEFYAEFLNKSNAFLKSKGVRPVVWHDMLVAGKSNLESLNGQLTYKALDKINKNIIVDCWLYSAMKRYKGLEKVKKSGHEIWVTPWFGITDVARLCSEGKRLGATVVLGSTWYSSYHLMPGFVQTAEFSWNTPKAVKYSKAIGNDAENAGVPADFKIPKLKYDPDNVVNAMFYGKDNKIWEKPDSKTKIQISGVNKASKEYIERLKKQFPGMTVDSPNIHFQIKTPYTFYMAGAKKDIDLEKNKKELRKFCAEKRLFFEDDSNLAVGFTHIDAINKSRLAKEAILYTSDFGDSTKTNFWGREWRINDGKIISDEEREDTDIPKNGYVLSVHGKRSRALTEQMQKNDKITFFIKEKISENIKPIKIKINSNGQKIKKIIMLFSAENTLPMYKVLQDHKKEAVNKLAKISLRFADGSKSKFTLKNTMFKWISRLNYSKNWSTWMAWEPAKIKDIYPVVAVEWNASANSKSPKQIIINAEEDGVYSTLVLLGCIVK
jgi:Glycosyl hydrolase family 20, catalytic domain/Glycosyl hydrolase family 20, domain 2